MLAEQPIWLPEIKDVVMKNAVKLSYAALLAGSLVLGSVVANPPTVPPRTPGIYYYYSDPGHQNLVGIETVECNRLTYFSYGSAGPYREFNQPYYCSPPIDW